MKIDGNKLKAAREQALITRSDLAKIAGLTHVRIWQIEQVDIVANVNDNIVAAMAKELRVKPAELEAV